MSAPASPTARAASPMTGYTTGETHVVVKLDNDVAIRHYALVEQAIAYLREHEFEQPDLAVLARHLDTSESHLQRVFSAWAGVSPKRFLQMLTRDTAVAALRQSASVLEASLRAGLSGPARLHDLTIACDALTPGEIASGGAGLALRYGWSATPFGPALIAFGARGICHLAFHDVIDSAPVEALVSDWPGARWVADETGARDLGMKIFARELEPGRLHLLLRGTNFQVRVWKALLAVGSGRRVSYAQLAKLAGNSGASRAVGSTMARNRIAYLIPCHRVIRGDGSSGDYRWGVERKLALQVWESGATETA